MSYKNNIFKEGLLTGIGRKPLTETLEIGGGIIVDGALTGTSATFSSSVTATSGTFNGTLKTTHITGAAIIHQATLTFEAGQTGLTTSGSLIYDEDGSFNFNKKVFVTGDVKASGYKSSDGSAGVTTNYSTGEGDTIVVKNGLITEIITP